MSQKIEAALSHKLANMGFVCVCLVVSLHLPFKVTEDPEVWLRFMWGGGQAQIAVSFLFWTGCPFDLHRYRPETQTGKFVSW